MSQKYSKILEKIYSVIEPELEVHENPFVCPSTDYSLRRAIMESLDSQLYGDSFEKFILKLVRH